jgi:hypothetical protein
VEQADGETGTMLLYLLQLLAEATGCSLNTFQVVGAQITADAVNTIVLHTFLLCL